VAILIPTLNRGNNPVVPPTSTSVPSSNRSDSGYSSSSSHSHNNHPYVFNFNGYTPTFDEFNEVAYYSHYIYGQDINATPNAALRPRKRLEERKADIATSERRQPYEDNHGRTHYPIATDRRLNLLNFVYFEFECENNEFVGDRIGNGHIYALSVQLGFHNAGDHLLILKNGDYYYSCLQSGRGDYRNGRNAYIQFSAHKTIEGFEVIKDFTNMRYLTLTFSGNNENQMNYDTPSTLDIEGEIYNIIPESVSYDPTEIVFTLDEFMDVFGLDPNYAVVDGYIAPDELVYDASESQTSTFTAEEYEGTFRVNENELYLNDNKLLDLNGASKIYLSEVNKDYQRELVFESLVAGKRVFNIFNIKGNKYLYQKPASDLNGNSVYEFSYGLAMVDNRLVVKLYELDHYEESYLLDYGYFAYFQNKNISVVWQNMYAISSLKVVNVLSANYEPLVLDYVNGYCRLEKDTPYILDIRLSKYAGAEGDYPAAEQHPLICMPFTYIGNQPTQTPEWTFLSMTNGRYLYRVQFHEKGYATFRIALYRCSAFFEAAIDYPDVVPEEDTPIENE